MRIVVCLKQVPLVAELPWDPKTGRLKRELAEGMTDPAAKRALEAGLRLKETHGGELIALCMGPPEAEEALREAIALGADRGYLLCHPALAGADTLATSRALAAAIQTLAPASDLVLLGSASSDSETGQVGPQLAEELDWPAALDVEAWELADGLLSVKRVSDGFLETLELTLPALLTLGGQAPRLRDTPLGGLEDAFAKGQVRVVGLDEIGLDPARAGQAGSGGRMLRVYSPAAQKKAVLLRGAVKKSVQELLDRHGDRLGGIIARDLGGAE
ncbi:MAG: electron transfer flavoprotein subunit beta/FixA family protein [Thermodesulfobacteriota bacterium]